jgi:hypothetical protein
LISVRLAAALKPRSKCRNRAPSRCQNTNLDLLLAKTVPYPAVSNGQSAKAALARHRAALGQANGNLVATRECQALQRERFARGF